MSDLDVQLKYKNKNGGYDNLYPKTKGDIVQMNDGRNVEQILDEVTDLYNQVIEDGTNSDVNSAPEIIAARNGKSNLKTRLDEEHAQVTAQLQQTTETLAGIDRTFGDRTFATVAELQTTYPTGDPKRYVVASDGKWYWWNGTAWTAGQVAQAVGIADGTMTPAKTSFYIKTGNLFNVLNPNTNLLSGALTIDSTENVSVIKLDGKPTALGAITVPLMTGSGATGNYIAFDTTAQYTLTAKLLRGKCFDSRAVTLAVQRTDTSANLASVNAGSLLLNGGELSDTFTPTFSNGKVSLIFSAGAYDINDCEILINITKSANSSVEPFGYRITKSVDDYEQNEKIESLIKHDMYDYIVDINGTGDFTSVTECVKHAPDMSVIYVKNGLYENEIVKAWFKTVFIVGESRDGVIITNSTGEYATPPVEMGTGLLRNLTIYAKDPGGLTPTNKAYALHSESTVYNYFKFEVDNCNIISDWRQSWGMGMRGGMVYNARNVNFDGGVYFHDNEHADGTVQRIFFDTCNMTRYDAGAALIFQDQQMANADIEVRFNRCYVKSSLGTNILFFKWDAINIDVIPATGFADFPSWGLNAFSWGNSEATLNA